MQINFLQKSDQLIVKIVKMIKRNGGKSDQQKFFHAEIFSFCFGLFFIFL